MDLKHVPELRETGAFCVNCDTEIPLDVAGLGEIIEMGGAGVHWIPAFAYDGKPKDCVKGKGGKAIVVCVICRGGGCNECGNEGVVISDGSTIQVKAAAPRRGEQIERAPSKTEHEKMMVRMASQNFWAMRQATDPNGGEDNVTS